MKTTIDIPEKVLKGAKTKREAVVAAVEEYNRTKRLQELAKPLHRSCPNYMSQDELRQMRGHDKWKR